ncbi:MAG TPA: 6-phosphogluconolactonase [Ktedonobacteraceae bacterium]|nr:6-phosphogluconolactonase [Ktedonobacteraceae bacterium]
MSTITVYSDAESWVTGVTDCIVDLATRAIAERGRFTFAFSGGNTPRPVYERLASEGYIDRIDWSRVEIFFGDERCVPPDDPQSNYQMARTALGERVPIPADNIHRMHGEQLPEQAAEEYAQELARIFGGDAKMGGTPPNGFDLVLLGMGDNGHTASLFPGLAAVTESVRWVMAQYVEVVGMWRVTLTPVILNAARNVAFLVKGSDKAEMLAKVLEGPYQPIVLPSQIIKPTNGDLRWLVDAAAAARLRRVS